MKNLNNSYWIVGKHPVEAAIKNTNREKLRLCITKKTQATHKIKNVIPEIMPREKISSLIGSSINHQGIALLVKPLKNINLIKLIEKYKNKKNILIILDQITDTKNIGAIIRSAQAFSATAIVCQEINSPKENSLISKSAAGALEHIPIIYVKNISKTLQFLKENNFWSIGLDAKAKYSLKYITRKNKFFNNNIALVLGSEGKGIRKLVMKNCDMTCKINITNTLDSLNVSVALAIALYEITSSEKM